MELKALSVEAFINETGSDSPAPGCLLYTSDAADE